MMIKYGKGLRSIFVFLAAFYHRQLGGMKFARTAGRLEKALTVPSASHEIVILGFY